MSETPAEGGPSREARLREIADAMISRYGANAIFVAQSQIKQSSGDIRETWEAIATLIASGSSRP